MRSSFECSVRADESNFFMKLSKGFSSTDPVGPDVYVNLAELVNTMLSIKPNEASMKSRNDTHLRPSNGSFMEVPKLNKEIWGYLSASQRANDVALQEVQKDILKSVIPVVKVIETLYKEKDTISSSPLIQLN